ILHACGANSSHGLRRTNADKRRAVETLLRDEEWSQWGDRKIARKCAVHHSFVAKIRRELTGAIASEAPNPL
ncbi:MAG: streptomycin biosynthesis regulator, partial [Alphaproteobacteria bacterium]